MDETAAAPELAAFREMAQSLKLYRRAELISAEGESLIERLYVDPLPNDHVLVTMLKPSTTFLIGRKGTGKSTIFQRAQHELRRTAGVASAYVDIKTVYESSQVDPGLMNRVTVATNAMPASSLERLLLYRAFLGAVIEQIRQELKERVRRSRWQKVRRKVGGTLGDLFADLDALLADASTDRFVSVLGSIEAKGTDKRSTSESTSRGASGNATVAPKPDVSLALEAKAAYSTTTDQEREYADILVKVFNIKEYISRLKALLEKVGITHLYVFVDDFSELPPDAMQVVVDAILAPLNNWSDELVKFKIAAYPNRIYYGQIDKTKIDEINLDIFSLYGSADLNGMEEKALDFTRRLFTRRLEYFGVAHGQPDVTPERFLSYRRADDLWRNLFYATMANPRTLGYILYFAYESNLIYGRQITNTAIRDAARRYYEEKIEADFNMNRFLHESFEERSSIFSLKELLDSVVERARELRRHGGLGRDPEGAMPTSHFHVVSELDGLLATLELNFFLTKYFVMSDRDGRKVTIFALNFGLCQKQSIEFGRPTSTREDRLYFVGRPFDFSSILQEYLRTNQEIVCGSCGAKFEYEQLPALQLFNMKCPRCKGGECQVSNLSRKYEAVLRAVADEMLLPKVELGILHTLGSENRPLFSADVAEELDCSYQLVGKRASFLSDRGLVNRDGHQGSRRVLEITDRARNIYFDDEVLGGLEPDNQRTG
jgi:DNA-binding MarR family transcriptional regulator